VERCKIGFLGGTSYSLVQTLLLQDVSFIYNAQRHRQTDRRTDDIVMLITDHTACSTKIRKKLLKLDF